VSETKLNISMETKLAKVADRSRGDSNAVFSRLMPLITKESLTSCFHELDGKKAVGADGLDKGAYGQNLSKNIEKLWERMRAMQYRPKPVKQVLIPKEPSGQRPLGISVIEDKIVQLAFAKVLEAVYEPIFRDCSYGFRRGRGCHDTIKALRDHLYRGRVQVVIDLDLRNFFGSIDHTKLVAILRMKIKDERFIRYIVRMLKSGVLVDDEFKTTDEGTPQGSIVSPVLANIFAHYALDLWIENTVNKHCVSRVRMFRYADDQVICCSNADDARRLTKALPRRLNRFGLEMNEEKSKVLSFDRDRFEKGLKQESFDFLGFTFFIGRTAKGFPVPMIKTASKKFNAKLRRVTEWCKKYRNVYKMADLWRFLCRKLVGHVNYFGISFNNRMVGRFIRRATKEFFKWMNRRSQKRSMDWERFNLFLSAFPPPKVVIRHRLF
jgi:RNA-directed DNA polymerase